MINAAELESLGLAVEAVAMPDRCSVLRPDAAVADEAGGSAPTTYTLIAVAVPCFFRALTGDEAQIAGATGKRASGVVLLRRLTDAAATDQLLVTIAETGEVKTLEVLPPVGGRSYEVVRKAFVVEVG